MNPDSNHYSEVLADLKERRISLAQRMTSIDSAIDSIGGLLDQGNVKALPVPPATQVEPHPVGADRRKKTGALNVYVNPYPEWGRAMARGQSVARKTPGIPCPKCGSCDTRKSLTRGLSDLLLFFCDFINARCRNCNARFRIWRTPETQASMRAPAPERHSPCRT